MHLPLLSSFLLASLALAQQINRTATNGWGSTPADRHYISHAQALAVIDAAVQESNTIGHVRPPVHPDQQTHKRTQNRANAANSVPNNIAVLDPSSHLVAFLRMDNAYLGSIDISIKKAKTVTSFNGLFPSSGLLTRAQSGGDLFGIEQTNGGLVVFGGGQPIYDHQGYWIGAVGVSGGTVEQDVRVSVAGARAVGTTIEDAA